MSNLDSEASFVETAQFIPEKADHLLLHYNPHIFHPSVPGVWGQKYAEQVASFVFSHARMKRGTRPSEALGRLTLAGEDFTKKRGATQTLSELHLAEAEVRNVTPWTFQRVLWMQENLYKRGFRSHSLIEQRGEIIKRLHLTPDDSLREMGWKVAGLELCIGDVWLIKDFDEKRQNNYKPRLQIHLVQNYTKIN